MKLLKSPVLYFGIFLLVTVLSALAAPYVIDWGRYRGDLQGWGEKLTGRQTAIRGDINIKLFPFPQLTAEDVVIANPDGFSEPIFAHIDRVTVQITLGGLINGNLQVEAIDLEGPSVTLIRTKDERLNWAFEPSGSVRNSALLEHVMLDQIKVSGGHVFFVDELRSVRSEAGNVEATISAPSLSGPWHSSGTFAHNGNRANFTLNSATWEQGRPLGIALRLSPADQAGYSLMADAQMEGGGRATGHLSVSPVVDEEGKSDSEGRMRSVTVNSDFAADFHRIELNKIEIRPSDTKDQGTMITGSASADIGQVVTAKLDLSAPRVDLDALVGAGSRQLLRDGGGLALLNGLVAALPADVELTAGIDVLALKAGGENLDNGRLSFTANRQSVNLHKLSANLPGRSSVVFDGVFYPGERTAELSGNLALETFDARALSGWLFPEAKPEIAKVWTGNRGHLKVSNLVRLTASKLEFNNVAYELNGNQGTGQFSALVNGERPILDLSLHARRLDFDDFLLPAKSSDGGANWVWLLQRISEEQSRRDLSLAIDADEFKLNGVEADGLKANIETTVRGFDLKTLEIASVGGAKVTASGLIINSGAGADGDITSAIAADDPRPLLRLLGIVNRGADPGWMDALGKTYINMSLAARAGGEQGSLKLAVAGSSGDFAISGDGVIGAQRFDNMTFQGSLQLKNPQSAPLWKLLAGTDMGSDSYASRLELQLDGSWKGDVKTKSDVELYGTTLGFEGVITPLAGAADGAVKASSADVTPLLKAMGVPLLPTDAGGPFSFNSTGRLKYAADTIDLTSLSGAWNEGPVSGELHLSHDRQLTGELDVAKVSLLQAAAFGFLPWNGTASFESLFGGTAPVGVSGEVWLRPKQLEFYPGLVTADGQIAVSAQSGVRQLFAYGKGSDGAKLAVEVKLDSSGDQKRITGSVVLPFDLAQVLGQVDDGRPFGGTAAVDLKLSGEGLSPAACLATMKGTGAFSLVGVTLRGVSPERFTEASHAAKDPAGLQRSLEAMKEGAGLAMRPTFGSLTIENGVAKVTPFSFETPDAGVTLTTTADLPTGVINIVTSLGLKALPNLPKMSVIYNGPPMALQRQEEAGDLAAFLGFKVLNQSVDELERLQAEQVRLAKAEELQRQEDSRKLALYTAQRTELRLRQREQRAWALQEQRDTALEQDRVSKLAALARTVNPTELARRSRELGAYFQ